MFSRERTAIHEPRHMMPLNNSMYLQLFIDAQSIRYRKRTLWIANSLRLAGVFLAFLFAPLLMDPQSGRIFLWESSLNASRIVLLTGSMYLILVAGLMLIARRKFLDERFFLFNGLAESFFLLLFCLALNPVANGEILGLTVSISIFLTVLTLNFTQCGIYALILYFEMLVIYTIWKIFPQINWEMFNLLGWSERFAAIKLAVFNQAESLQSPNLIFLATAMLIILFGYLSSQARENKILAQLNSASATQLRQLNETIFSDLPTGLVVINLRGEIITMNRRAREMFHLAHNTMLPHQLKALSPEIARRQIRWESLQQSDLSTLKVNKQNYSLEFTHLTLKDYAPLIMISLENIESSYQRVRETRLASLGRLTAGIAHEIRNPLGSVQSANELIGELCEDPQVRYLSEKITNNTKRMNAIISDILNMFTDQPRNTSLINLNNFLQQTVKNSRADDALENIDIYFKIKASEGFAVFFDPGHLSQVIHNLMLNSTRHSGREDVEITIGTEVPAKGRNVYLYVRDNGDGIAKEDQEKVFEPFFSRRQGTGLGLYLVREMCLANQAKIEYIERTRGACFRITMERYLPDVQSAINLESR